MNLQPELALVVYGDDNRREHLLSLHRIQADAQGAPTLGAGRLLGPADARALASLLCGKHESRPRTEFLPERLLCADDDGVTWYRPAAVSTQYWRTQDGRVTLHAVLPGLMFHARARALYVAAYAQDGRPSPSTPMFHAPLGNIYDHTGVCLGNVSLPPAATAAYLEAWERVLLGSNYAHVNHHATLRGDADTHALLAFWKRRERSKTPPAERFLSPLNMSASSWLDSIQRGARGGED